eukprot:g7022.t1
MNLQFQQLDRRAADAAARFADHPRAAEAEQQPEQELMQRRAAEDAARAAVQQQRADSMALLQCEMDDIASATADTTQAQLTLEQVVTTPRDLSHSTTILVDELLVALRKSHDAAGPLRRPDDRQVSWADEAALPSAMPPPSAQAASADAGRSGGAAGSSSESGRDNPRHPPVRFPPQDGSSSSSSTGMPGRARDLRSDRTTGERRPVSATGPRADAGLVPGLTRVRGGPPKPSGKFLLLY